MIYEIIGNPKSKNLLGFKHNSFPEEGEIVFLSLSRNGIKLCQFTGNKFIVIDSDHDLGGKDASEHAYKNLGHVSWTRVSMVGINALSAWCKSQALEEQIKANKQVAEKEKPTVRKLISDHFDPNYMDGKDDLFAALKRQAVEQAEANCRLVIKTIKKEAIEVNIKESKQFLCISREKGHIPCDTPCVFCRHIANNL